MLTQQQGTHQHNKLYNTMLYFNNVNKIQRNVLGEKVPTMLTQQLSNGVDCVLMKVGSTMYLSITTNYTRSSVTA